MKTGIILFLLFIPLLSFSGRNLQWADLSGVDLREVKLQGANLIGANLMGANLRGMDLRETDLRRATVTKKQAEYLKSKGYSGFVIED